MASLNRTRFYNFIPAWKRRDHKDQNTPGPFGGGGQIISTDK